jgi:hypothetical protein
MPDLALAEVDAELCSLLGQIVVRWSALEYLLSLLLGTLLSAELGA